jgi:hypothetical protein
MICDLSRFSPPEAKCVTSIIDIGKGQSIVRYTTDHGGVPVIVSLVRQQCVGTRKSLGVAGSRGLQAISRSEIAQLP